MNVFQELSLKITSDSLTNTFIVFLSDGQDNEGVAKHIPFMETFKTSFKKTITPLPAIHTIEFSGDNDAS